MRRERLGNTEGDVRSPFGAPFRLLRRWLPPLLLTVTLVVLGVLSWPTEVTETTTRPVTEEAMPPTTVVHGAARFGTAPNRASVISALDQTSTSVTTIPNSGVDPEAEPCFAPLFRDDFDGDVLDPAWQVYNSNGNHSPHAVRKAEAVSVDGGVLVITAANDTDGVAASGGLRLSHSQAYGRYAFRVRTDPDPTNTTSGVVLTWPVSESQPLDGENNIYETLRAPGSRAPFYSFIHEPFDQSADGISQIEFTHLGDATQWQELTMDWTPAYVSVTWRDPASGEETTQRFDETAADLITDAEHFLAIQLDLFKGAFPDDRSVQMEVDWVEVHSFCG